MRKSASQILEEALRPAKVPDLGSELDLAIAELRLRITEMRKAKTERARGIKRNRA